MATQTVVIGLGQFGSSLARSLSERGAEVLAVDIREEAVREIAPHVADAVHMDAMDEEALASLAPDQRDVSICAIGNENREGSMIVTALLKQLGAPRVVSRATDPLHARVLSLIGADEVVMPERYFGERLAVRLTWGSVADLMPIGGDLVLTELEVPEAFVGQTLRALELPQRFDIVVAGLRRTSDTGEITTVPHAEMELRESDVLIIVGTADDARRLEEGRS